MAKKKHETLSFDAADYYNNRELSWVAFNRRVLEMAQHPELPPLERLKFLAIFSSNLDEFFMIRVAGLYQQVGARIRKRDISGQTPLQQLQEIDTHVHALVSHHTEQVNLLLQLLRKHNLHILRRHEWSEGQRSYLKDYFMAEILPVLTPLALECHDPCPLLPGLQMNVALTVQIDSETPTEARLLVIPVPDLFMRFLTLPTREGTHLVAIEDIIADNASAIFQGGSVQSVDFFRLTRDADVSVKEEDASDLLNVMEAAIIDRRRRTAVRLELSAHASQTLRKWLIQEYKLRHTQVYEIDGLLDAKAFFEIADRSGLDHLRYSDWSPQTPLELVGYESLWDAVADHDVLMYHPYESFEPVVQFLQQAAEDPSVLAIKQILYRISSDSPIIKALEQAAEKGKEVTILVELKARFDEARNVQWARRLEDAGCHVIYGIVGLKTHAKALLVVRREKGRIQRYVHLATGNYNDKTAKLYSDLGFFSCDTQITADVAAFFNVLTGFSESVGWSTLTLAPVSMKNHFIKLIEREISASTPDRPGLIMAKMNSLEDKEICQALYRASRQGVKIRLNVRGICCLRSGLKGVSENIEVLSVLGRYLEHARIFYFANGGHPDVYLSSADWMSRNLDKRLELLFPMTKAGHIKRCKEILDICFSDNTHAWRLQSDGTYQPVASVGEKKNAQAVFYKQVVSGHRQILQYTQRLRPVKHTGQ